MKKIALIVGTRPEVVKMAPLYIELKKSPLFDPVLISTGQHREMLQQMFDVFELVPDIDLNLMSRNQSLASLTSRILESVSEVFKERMFNAVMVQGDTTTAFAASVAAFYSRIPIGHVEAGLRTHDLRAPWPEEFNRRMIDPMCAWCFAPTEMNRNNLLQERIEPKRIHVTGNTVIDALLLVRKKLLDSKEDVLSDLVREGLSPSFAAEFLGDPRSNQKASCKKRFILVTAHRRESFGFGIERICQAILELTEKFADLGVIFPVHLNPNVQDPVKRLLANNSKIQLIRPVDYESFVWLTDQCLFVISDSGGVQEEAPSLGKPVLVTRDTTERQEGVEAGTCRLVGTSHDNIVREATELLSKPSQYASRTAIKNPYGDGDSAKRILNVLMSELS